MTTRLPSEEELWNTIEKKNYLRWDRAIDKRRIMLWLNNFTGKVLNDVKYERQLALWLLTNYVYYNQSEVRNLCKVLYRRYLHVVLEADLGCDSFNKEVDPENIVRSTGFYALGNPSESGAYVLYYFRQSNMLPIESFPIEPTNVTRIAMIDDVTLSGDQASEYLNQLGLGARSAYLLTLISTETAKTTIKRETGIDVISSVTLDDRCKCFSPSSSVFHDFKDHLDLCKRMAQEYGRKLLPNHPLGWEDGQYSFGFFYNTPDNTLPIFWSNRGKWIPLFTRFQKLKGEVNTSLEHFI